MILESPPEGLLRPDHSLLLISRQVNSEYVVTALKHGVFNFRFADHGKPTHESLINLEMEKFLSICHVQIVQLKDSRGIEPPILKPVQIFLHRAIKKVYIFWSCFSKAEDGKVLKVWVKELAEELRNIKTLENVEVILAHGGDHHSVGWHRQL